MPLDGHTYLVNQGWGGKGTALRAGALSRPLAIPQKKTLAGLGKDRDEAFPFWDHLFSAAAKLIQVKCLSDDEDSADELNSDRALALKRTSTGILSNRRPADGTPATSGSSTPLPQNDTPNIKLSLIASAKRDAAKRGLYSRFFRGPVLGPESLAEEERRLAALVSEAFSDPSSQTQAVTVKEHIKVKTKDGIALLDLEVSQSTRKKRRKARDEGHLESDETRRERKRQRKEERRAKQNGEVMNAAQQETKARKLEEVAEEEQRRQTVSTLPLDEHKGKSSKKSLSNPPNCGSPQAVRVEKRKKKRDEPADMAGA